MVDTKVDTLTLASITCIGMATLANTKKSPPMALAARQKYIEAMSLTRTALNNHSSAAPKTILASVLFLAMFEVRPLCCALHPIWR